LTLKRVDVHQEVRVMRHVPGRRPPDESDTQARYSARHFLEDGQRLLAKSQPTCGTLRCVDRPDGRLLPLPTDPLRRAMTASREGEACFSSRYGEELGEEHAQRFRLVLDYVESHCDELTDAGVACAGEPIAVREEFLDYLLNCRVEPARRSIPANALARFLDEWGLRWM
jgi:hypothetical protein